MNKVTKLIAIPIFALLGSACINTSTNTEKLTNEVINQFVSGIEVNPGSRPIQTLNDSFEATPNDGPIINQTVEVFKLDNGKCLSLVTLYNESGFGGYEDLFIFRDNQVLVSLQRNLFFSKENGPVTKKSISYDNNIDDSQRTKSILKDDFNRYKQEFNLTVVSTCK
ncbi:hypothetical protein [Psychrobacter sp. FME5]|uniref:hypothetical protein n=1 Tax=unclassified Psychrobacter TaxID=196806 RepID=UPI0017887D19|nr:hypothetical protein [Psychrobacter sp. FME5]MBE0446299.1 hypothetical protein [Psychrobacter sp. FME5]